MQERTISATDYRYGFNGQEQDKEWLGGQAVSFKFRIHDARIGRFLSVDPLAPEYPWNSTYAFAENNVIWALDLEGAEELKYTDNLPENHPIIQFVNSSEVLQEQLITSISDPTVNNVEVYFTAIDFTNIRSRGSNGFTWELTENRLAIYNSVEERKAYNRRYGRPINEGLTQGSLKSFEMTRRLFNATGLNATTAREKLDNNEKVLIVALRESNINDLEMTSEALAKVVFSFGHEIIAHLKKKINGTSVSENEEHHIFFGLSEAERAADPVKEELYNDRPDDSGRGLVQRMLEAGRSFSYGQVKQLRRKIGDSPAGRLQRNVEETRENLLDAEDDDE